MIEKIVLDYSMFSPSHVYLMQEGKSEIIDLNNKSIPATANLLAALASKHKTNKIDVKINNDDFYNKIREHLLKKNSNYEVSRI